MDSMKKQKGVTPEDEPTRSESVHHATGKSSGGQLLTAPERTKQLDQSGNDSVVGVSGGKSKVGCCKEQYCTGTWNVRSIINIKWKWSNGRWQD